MTEFEKMRSEEFYDFTSEECLASYYRADYLGGQMGDKMGENLQISKLKIKNLQKQTKL